MLKGVSAEVLVEACFVAEEHGFQMCTQGATEPAGDRDSETILGRFQIASGSNLERAVQQPFPPFQRSFIDMGRLAAHSTSR